MQHRKWINLCRCVKFKIFLICGTFSFSASVSCCHGKSCQTWLCFSPVCAQWNLWIHSSFEHLCMHSSRAWQQMENLEIQREFRLNRGSGDVDNTGLCALQGKWANYVSLSFHLLSGAKTFIVYWFSAFTHPLLFKYLFFCEMKTNKHLTCDFFCE